MAGKKKASKENVGLDLTIDAINKEFGVGSLFRVGTSGRIVDTPKFSSGSPKLDRALAGGYGRGRIVEIYGPESSGKTTLCLHAIREIQETGGMAAFIDVEHALDVEYASSLGVDIDSLLVSQPGTAEEALNIADRLVRTGAVQLIIIDSVAALVPKAELEGQIGDSHVGLQSRLMSQALRMMTPAIQTTNCTVIFTNQIRMKIGVMFGNPETTSGGNALKFYASQRLDIRRTATNKTAGDDGEAYSNTVRVKVVKNKIGPPFRIADLDIEFGTGLNIHAEILDLAVEYEIVDKSGAWYSYQGERIGQGRPNAIAFLQEHEELFTTLNLSVRKKLFGEVSEALATVDPEGDTTGLELFDE